MDKQLTHIQVKDFVLIVGSIKGEFSIDGFISYANNEEMTIIYKSDNSITNWLICFDQSKIKIHCLNALLPFFKYSNGGHTIITPNYTHLFIIAPYLTINNRGIQEFILYHTPQNTNTFHNEVSRISGVTNILADEGVVKFEYFKPEERRISVQELFTSRINKQIKNTINQHNAVLLSGGSESRINAAIGAKYQVSKDFITWGHPANLEYLIAHKISEKLNTKHINIRPDINSLPYNELLLKSGYLANMQFAYRYSVVKKLFEDYGYDCVWTGWGDINGYPYTRRPSELFTDYYLGLYKNETRLPTGWNKEFLKDFLFSADSLGDKVKTDKSKKTFFEIKSKILSPAIFGQVLSVENTLGFVLSPWFQPDIYHAIEREEFEDKKIVTSKKWRTIWKNELYFQLVKYYCPKLNYIRNTKGYYPLMVRKRIGIPGLMIALIMKQYQSRKTYPFDHVEDKKYLMLELSKIEGGMNEIFSREEIHKIIKNNADWEGPDIVEYFKLIQVNKLLNR